MKKHWDLGALTVEAEELSSGECVTPTEWSLFETSKLYTNSFVIDKEQRQVLLGFKKRGLGEGLYNGFGGKVDAGEHVKDAALRELQEESGISAPLEHAGTLLFTNQPSTLLHHIEIFRAYEWSGTITESEEMRPIWFSTSASQDGSGPALEPIPFDRMWPDDRLWFSYLLERRPFVGRVDFGEQVVPGDWSSAPLLKWWFGQPERPGPLRE